MGATLIAVLALAGLVLLVVIDLPAAARGGLAGWFAAFSVALGAAALVLIHGLTGGRWRAAGEPWLPMAAALVPALAVLGLGIVALMGWLYPWATASWAQASPDGGVAAIWFDKPFFAARVVAALLAFVAVGFLARGRPGPRAAAAGLVLFALAISLAGLDWLLTLDPSFTSTDFAMQMVALQIGCGLALPAALGLSEGDATARADWSKLLIAAILGTAYLAFMQYLVSWSGDLPGKATWYLARQGGTSTALIWAALWLGAILPMGFLLTHMARRSRAGARLAGISALLGAWAHFAWIVAPAGPGQGPAILASVLALLALGGAAVALTGRAAP